MICKSHVACSLAYKFPCVTSLAFADRGWRETLPSRLKGNIKVIDCGVFCQKISLGNLVSTFIYQEIPRRNSICSATAWFQGNTSRKFLNPLLFNLPVFFFFCRCCCFFFLFVCLFVFFPSNYHLHLPFFLAKFHGLSCLHVQAGWYLALLRVSLSACIWVWECFKRSLHSAKGPATCFPIFLLYIYFIFYIYTCILF